MAWDACHGVCFGTISEELKVVGGEDVDLGKEDAERVILVLESPHRSEYYYGNGRLKKGKILPCQGKTGHKIEEFFPYLLNSKFNGWCLCVVNAVQYPCSLCLELNYSVKKLRNKIFREAFGNLNFRQDFINELKRFFRKDSSDVIINACTEGKEGLSKGGMGNRALVDQLIRNFLSDDKIIQDRYSQINHPISWEVGALNIVESSLSNLQLNSLKTRRGKRRGR